MNLGLIIYGSLDTLSGGYYYDRRLVEYLRAQGDAVMILSLPWRNYASHLLDNLTFRLPGSLDLLIQDELNHPSLLGANARPHPCPVISLVHHLRCMEERPRWQNSFYHSIEQHYLHGVDGFIFNSETTRKEVEALLPATKPSITAFPPTDRFGLRVTEEEVIARARQPGLRILFLGNVIPRKGLHTLLTSLRELPADVRLDVVGSLEVDPVYVARQQKAAGGLAVAFHGSLPDEQLIPLMQASQVLVVPSSQEGFGIVYVEGMGFGLPAIGGSPGAAAEVIHEGEDGFVVPSGNPEALTRRMLLLYKDRELLIHMALAARSRFLQQPVWASTGASIRNFLQEML